MPVCTHRGCEKTYDEATNSDTACQFHPQGPIFHEGLKGWSCCSKRVVSFDQFLAIPGCSFGRHTDAPREEFPAASPSEKVEVTDSTTPAPVSVNKDGTEVYGSSAAAPAAPAPLVAPAASTTASAAAPSAPTPEPIVEEEDDLSIPVAVGKTCMRRGCGQTYVSEEESRGDKVKCQYHPGTPVFHEGSKGWSCCSRKVLEFDEFLKLKGCTTTNQHLFVGAKKEKVEELVQCRHDWYQTQTHVNLSIFAKKVDPKTAVIEFKEREVNIDLKMPDEKRFKLNLPLFQPIDPSGSSFEVLGTKVEITMKKGNGISWATLEPSEGAKCWTTFGTTGGAGTVGSKVMHLATDSPLYAQK
ncbi:hypothetical protein BX616_005255 [Lobosporangium transversale]|uniref:HSP20-like chaperone n=1 Tax=Lobosporangium transversale TaxID=64571 RepID=A0A1Y2GIY1_9FUNG|nr:hypothetical protein BCR41DRAFT_378188 [Lobosporangium transversale]KAF9915835.1 hypothetical protein BX616_005255 [Lobosporangium transversale]ORZ12175.1 hypothetical protein BCR41DRAFT_378188 [Lobosporangium transversale]|eukprot:XP_021880040.1 hypothetical protein BCR41DRAFT_378188 [Lobosporangium transversale]